MPIGTEMLLRVELPIYNMKCRIGGLETTYEGLRCSPEHQLKPNSAMERRMNNRYRTGMWKVPIEQYRSLQSEIDI